MAYFAAVILVNVRSLLKQDMYYDHVWDLLFSVFFFQTLWKFFALFKEVSIFSQTTVPIQ